MVSKRQAHVFAGMNLGLLVSILSDRGREILIQECGINPNRIQDQVHMIEIILGMEEYLKHGDPTKNKLNVWL